MFHPIHLYFYCICVLNVLYLNLYLCCDDDDVCVYDLQMSHPIAMNLQLAIFRSDLRPPAGNRKLYLSIIFIFVNNCYQKNQLLQKFYTSNRDCHYERQTHRQHHSSTQPQVQMLQNKTNLNRYEVCWGTGQTLAN